MTPKEKAIELVDRYYSLFSLEFENTIDITEAQKCALIALDEILNNSVNYIAYDGVVDNELWVDDEYWQEVKQEIENI
jgi:hypothetical protein